MISKSVGIGGVNKPDDLAGVQGLLNGFVKRLESPTLEVDGDCGHKTRAAISAFQDDVVGMEAPDGRDDAGNGFYWGANLTVGATPGAALNVPLGATSCLV